MAISKDEVLEAADQIETDNISEEILDSSSNIEKPNETSVRRLSLFDTLSTENKSEDISSENEVLGKTEPVFASSEENESEDKNSEDNNSSIDGKEEFSAEETESSEIDDEFNQETEEELLDIPTFLRRQAN